MVKAAAGIAASACSTTPADECEGKDAEWANGKERDCGKQKEERRKEEERRRKGEGKEKEKERKRSRDAQMAFYC